MSKLESDELDRLCDYCIESLFGVNECEYVLTMVCSILGKMIEMREGNIELV